MARAVVSAPLPTPEAVRDEVRARLEAQATPERAKQEKRYLKSDLTFLGATQPMIRREGGRLAKALGGLTAPALVRLVDVLWRTRVHELRSVGIALLERRVALLNDEHAPWLVRLAADSKTWAHVDWLATKAVGPLVERDPATAARLDTWAKDDDFWVRRVALLAWHDALARGGGDFAHFARLAAPMLGEREFFIRKAIGWVLRATARRQPEKTVAFVEAHAAALAGLSFREATRTLPAAVRERLTRLRTEGLAPKAPRAHRPKRKG